MDSESPDRLQQKLFWGPSLERTNSFRKAKSPHRLEVGLETSEKLTRFELGGEFGQFLDVWRLAGRGKTYSRTLEFWRPSTAPARSSPAHHSIFFGTPENEKLEWTSCLNPFPLQKRTRNNHPYCTRSEGRSVYLLLWGKSSP